MAARDDYHHLYDNRYRTGVLGAEDADSAMDEIDKLRRKVIEYKVAAGELGIGALIASTDR